MTISRWVGGYVAHPDPLTAACNRIALLVASNQPFYPLYVRWLVGGDWQVACWTFLSTPVFLAVPVVARGNARAGRALLPLAGIANALLSIKAFGYPSGVALFLIPCGLIAFLGFRRAEWRTGATLLAATMIAALVHTQFGIPLGRFSTTQYAHLQRLNATSVIALCAVILWSLSRARASSARR